MLAAAAAAPLYSLSCDNCKNLYSEMCCKMFELVAND